MNTEPYINKLGNVCIEFEDHYKTECMLSEEKSKRGLPLICFQYEVGGGISLSQKELKKLIPTLTKFIETGRIT